MSFDDGFEAGMTSNDDFRAKFAAAMDERGIGMAEMCQRAGVEMGLAMRLIEQGTYGLPGSAPSLTRLLQVLGLDLGYLVGSTEVPPAQSMTLRERRRDLRTRAWDYLIRSQVPRSHRRPFVTHCLTLLESRPSNSVRLAARAPVPRTTLDFAFLYERLARDGFFRKGNG